MTQRTPERPAGYPDPWDDNWADRRTDAMRSWDLAIAELRKLALERKARDGERVEAGEQFSTGESHD